MTVFTKTAADIFSAQDASGAARKVSNHDVQVWGTEVERAIKSFQAGGGVVFDSKTEADGSLDYSAYTMAWVFDDNPSFAGIYQKQGASGSGSWQRVGDLPYSFILATNTNSGDPDAIEATTAIPIPAADGGALIALPIVADNTGSPVTVSFNGGPALTIKTIAGNDVPASALTSGMTVWGFKAGTDFRLVTDLSSAGILAGAEAAAEAAEDAAEAAEDAASRAQSYSAMLSADKVKFKTVAALLADETMSYTPGSGLIEVGPGDIIEAQGFRYEIAASDATDAHIETAGGVKIYVVGPIANVQAFGAHGDATAIYPNVTIGSGSTTLVISTGSFTADDVGKVIMVGGAGPDGEPLVTTISAYTSTTEVTLADAAATALTASRQNVTFGYDDTEAFQKCAENFLSWTVPAGKYIVSDTIVLRAGSSALGPEGRFNTHVYRIADVPIFQAENAGTGRTQGLRWGGLSCFGRGATDTATVVDFRGVSYLYANDYQITGDPLGSGGVSNASCLGLDITRGGASFNGYIKLKGGFIWYCDIGLDAHVNQLEIEGGFLNANKTYGGRVKGANLKITNTEISSNGRGQVANYVGTYPDGEYDKGGLLLDNVVGYDIAGVWSESNANRSGSTQHSRNDIEVKSNCRRGRIAYDRRDQSQNLRVHDLGLDTGSYDGAGLSPQTHGFRNLIRNGRMQRLNADGTAIGWTDAGTITTEDAQILPPSVGGKRLTASAGVTSRRQMILSPDEVAKHVGRTLSATFWIAVPDADWTGGQVRAGLTVNNNGSLSSGDAPSTMFIGWGADISQDAGRPIRVTCRKRITGTETNGLWFSVQFFRTSGPWSVEIGDISAAIGDVVPAEFEKSLTTGMLADAYTTSNVVTTRTFDANATTVEELADVLGTLLADLKSAQILP